MSKLKTEEEGYYGKCWCGTKRGWFSETFLEDKCGGMGELNCYCGGDLCVCHNHGAVECFGCTDCDDDNEDDYYDEDY